jgi:copper chaperone
MKRIAVVLLFGLIVVGVTFAGSEKSVKIEVSDMHCKKCVDKVEKALKGIDGVKEVSVSLEKKSAEVVLSENATVSTEKLVQVVADAGFSAKSGTTVVKAKKANMKEECMGKEGCCSGDKGKKADHAKKMKKSS